MNISSEQVMRANDSSDSRTASENENEFRKEYADALLYSNEEKRTLLPETLSLIELTQSDIDHIADCVPGGVANIQDIYPLSPLQDGILFHHLLAVEGDPYLVMSMMAFETRELLDRYLDAFQKVADRHDILRTAFFWDGLSTSAQVVCRSAPLPVLELTLDPADGPIKEQLESRFNPKRYRIDLCQAPLFRFVIAKDANGQWLLVQLIHHLTGDHDAAEEMNIEIKAFMDDLGGSLQAPRPFRELIAQSRLKSSPEVHTRFFKEMLEDVDEPTLPYGLTAVYNSSTDVTESHQILPQRLNTRLRVQATKLGVSLATLCHVAWAQVLARTSGQKRVVFGTVLFRRMQADGGSGSVLGLSINTLPFRCDIDERGVLECVQETHSRLMALLEHEHASLALVQQCSSVPAGTSLFSALLNYRHTSQPTNGSTTSGSEFVSEEEQFQYPGVKFLSGQERTNYPICLSVEDFSTALGLTVQVMHPIDPVRVCTYVRQAMENLVEALETSRDVPVQQLEALPVEELQMLTQEWNATQENYPADLCLHHLFEQQVERTPEAIAVVFKGQSFTYAEVNTRANSLAHRLIDLGIQPDDLVAICVERSPASVIGILAILKAGSAYVPLDPFYASDRLRDIIIDAAPTILIADQVGRDSLKKFTIQSLVVLDPNTNDQSSTSNPNVVLLTSRHLAYVIYTSGSTGKPKGVMLEHQGAVNLVHRRPELFEIHTQSRVLQNTSLSFDHSVSEIFSTLCCGASLYLIQDEIRLNRHRLWDFLARNEITHISFTPTQLHDCRDLATLEKLQTFILMGETMPPHLPGLLKTVAPNSIVINSYGPTETSVSTTLWKWHSDFSGHTVPIGQPLSNKTIYLLDAYGDPVPMGAVGEIYIGGIGVARGYLNRPELTAERFLPDPFSTEPGARIYRTGDMARHLPDGNIVCLGRNDHQVKIRGFRIELGEIEARLLEHSLVSEAVVIVLGEGSNKRLAAYVIANPEYQTTQASGATQLSLTLRSHLVGRLPEYMVPSAFVCMDAFPLTPNGKLDRQALPTPGDDDFARQNYEAPQGEIENSLATIWAELLHLDRGLDVVIPPNLITPGATHIVPEMLPLIDLTQTEIDHIVQCVPGGVANIQDIYALSPAQDGALFHHLLPKSGDPYLIYTSMACDSRASLDRYLAAMQQMVNRHDILRTALVWENLSTSAQVVWRDAPLSITELELDPADGPISDQLKHKFGPLHHRMDLTKAPLLRFVIAQDSDDRWILVELYHHLIGDHTTFDIIDTEVQAFSEGRGDTLPPAYPYRNLIAQVRLGTSDEAHEKFFKDMLAEIDTPSLPFGQADVLGDGAEVKEWHMMLPQDLNNRLRPQASRLGVSLASLCHVAWGQVIGRTSGQQRVVFGTVLFGRMQGSTSSNQALGLFVNTLPLRVDLDRSSVEVTVRATHARLAALLEHEHASLALAQRCSSVPAGMPLFSSILNYRHNTALRVEIKDASDFELIEVYGRNNYPFMMAVDDYGTALGLTSQIVQPLDSARICEYMQEALVSLVTALESNLSMPVSQLQILPMEERQMLMQEWNAIQENYPADLCLHHLFEQQVERTPEAIAVVFKGQSFTYAEVNTRANSLAHRLIDLGIQPDDLVAICVERSPASIIGILAIHKAGSAYVPLDPFYASDRLQDILHDIAPFCLVADKVGRATLGETTLSTLMVLDPNVIEVRSVSNPLIPNLTSHHLAYVIYTSGTTGKPKGVMIEHHGVINFVICQQKYLQIQPSSRTTQFFSISFDASVIEIFGTLCFGGSLHLLQDSLRLDRHQLWGYLEQHRITHAIFIPSMLQDCGDLTPLGTVTKLVLAGEPLMAAVTRKVHVIVPNSTIINEYGPTETTVVALAWEYCEIGLNGVAPIGQPLANNRVYLLDVHGNPVPRGVLGEIYIGGVGVARGYLNRPELTAEKFMPDPFSTEPGARMYRTGDMARHLPDGNIVCLGRNDHQVKIRGFRIELGEIEARLLEHSLVSEAVVIVLGEGSNKRLAAYVIANPEYQTTQASGATQLSLTLRSHLVGRLPEYMVPSAFVCMDAFPLTPNGKLDRQALPTPGDDDLARQNYEAPQGEIENALASIWVELLNVDKIGRSDSFFVLGGHSLLAVRMISRIRTLLGFDLSLRTLFEFPTIAELTPRLLATGASQEESFDVLLPIKPQGNRFPLFCIHPSTGLGWCYTGLATRLHPDQPLYGLQARGFIGGLQARGFIGGQELASNLDEMVLDYVCHVRRVQPHGPYHLLGYSFGGLVAHAMAVYLQKQGERVTLVALMDTPADLYGREKRHFGKDEPNQDYIQGLVGNKEMYSPDLINPFLDKAPLIFDNNNRIARLQRPSVFNGDILLFHATVQNTGVGRLIAPDSWKPHALGSIEICDIECGHMQMYMPEPTAEIARILNRKLDESHSREQIEK
ncbi:hypothetical protein BGZ83_009471 [Gryganskiella cystojenkinii]|nr:hypothetical protein BGZ83_009471 [Gryganskiella cystojenkinii]